MSDRDELAAALYRLEWDADLYFPPRSLVTVSYERRAERLLASDWLARVKAEAAAEALESKATELYADESAERGSTTAAYHAVYAAWLLEGAHRIRSENGVGDDDAGGEDTCPYCNTHFKGERCSDHVRDDHLAEVKAEAAARALEWALTQVDDLRSETRIKRKIARIRRDAGIEVGAPVDLPPPISHLGPIECCASGSCEVCKR